MNLDSLTVLIFKCNPKNQTIHPSSKHFRVHHRLFARWFSNFMIEYWLDFVVLGPTFDALDLINFSNLIAFLSILVFLISNDNYLDYFLVIQNIFLRRYSTHVFFQAIPEFQIEFHHLFQSSNFFNWKPKFLLQLPTALIYNLL